MLWDNEINYLLFQGWERICHLLYWVSLICIKKSIEENQCNPHCCFDKTLEWKLWMFWKPDEVYWILGVAKMLYKFHQKYTFFMVLENIHRLWKIFQKSKIRVFICLKIKSNFIFLFCCRTKTWHQIWGLGISSLILISYWLGGVSVQLGTWRCVALLKGLCIIKKCLGCIWCSYKEDRIVYTNYIKYF